MRKFPVPAFYAAVAALFLFAPSFVAAQTQKDSKDCFSTGTDDYKDKSFFDIAIAACDRMIKSGRLSNRDIADHIRGKAYWLHKKGLLDEALNEYNRALQINPNLVEAYDYRADIFLERGEYERAIGEYNRVIQLNAKYVAAYYSRGRAQEKLGRIDDARRSYHQALAISATDRVDEWAHNQARKRLDEIDKR